jgi:hypothetical protein
MRPGTFLVVVGVHLVGSVCAVALGCPSDMRETWIGIGWTALALLCLVVYVEHTPTSQFGTLACHAAMLYLFSTGAFGVFVGYYLWGFAK